MLQQRKHPGLGDCDYDCGCRGHAYPFDQYLAGKCVPKGFTTSLNLSRPSVSATY